MDCLKIANDLTDNYFRKYLESKNYNNELIDFFMKDENRLAVKTYVFIEEISKKKTKKIGKIILTTKKHK